MVEITAPVGDYETLMSAIKAGADSVYFGIKNLNMRAWAADNFELKDLKKIKAICKKHKVKAYLTLNTIIYDNDLKLMKQIVNKAKQAKIDAIVAHDISVLEYAKGKIPIHISTQANISNSEALKFYSKYADVVVLARELTLQQIKDICKQAKKLKVKIELFAHGALCVSIAGKCQMSLSIYNKPANRGLCLQNCRRAYIVKDEETGDELKVQNKYIMSPKDLCTISFLDKILNAGVDILKIEGRGKSPDYVYTTVKVYKEAVNAVKNKTYTKNNINKWIKELESVFNRGFWHGGYYLGKKLGEWSGVYGSKAKKERVYLGKALNYYQKSKIGEFYLETGELKLNDNIMITGPTTGIVKTKVKSMYANDKNAEKAEKGDNITIPVPEKIRKNDKLYLIKDKTKLQGE